MTVAEFCVFGAVLLYLLTIAPFKPIGWREIKSVCAFGLQRGDRLRGFHKL